MLENDVVDKTNGYFRAARQNVDPVFFSDEITECLLAEDLVNILAS